MYQSRALYDSPSASSSSRPTPQPPNDMFPDTSAIFPDPEEEGTEENIFRDMSFQDILEELNARFLVNLPREEQGLVRVYWQAEQAHWFYEDYLRPLNPLLPSLSQRNFTHLIIASSPLYTHLSDDEYDEVWEEYCKYKRMVPCCGGILINDDGDKVLMVRGWKANAGWSFPRGKINSEEPEEACAIREVEEETGFDLSGMINKKDSIVTQVNAQTITMFIVKGIDENTVFQTQTRKEIGAIEWVPFSDLPTWTGKRGPKTTTERGKKRFYNVTPFVGPLKRWLSEHGINPHPKKKAARASDPVPLRALEPFQFDSPPSTPPRAAPRTQSSVPPTPQQAQAQASALDHLFNRFIHKQNQDLQAPGLEENKAGLERLFGNLSVLSPDKAPAGEDEKAREAKEDDALARLLAGLTGTPTPHPAEPDPVDLPVRTERASRLLAMLNPASPQVVPQETPSHPPQGLARTQGQLQPSPTETPRFPSNMRPHQASLLAVLSPDIHNRSTPTSVSSDDTVLPHMTRPTSLPTSPRPPSPGHAQVERSRRQRALLEQITAGIGLDVPAPHQSYPNQSQTIQIPPPSGNTGPGIGNSPHSGIGPPASVPVTAGTEQYSSRRTDHYSPTNQQGPPPSSTSFGQPPAGTGRPPPPPYESPIYGNDRPQQSQHQQAQQAQYQSAPQPMPQTQVYQQQSQPGLGSAQYHVQPTQAQPMVQLPNRPPGPPEGTQYSSTGPGGQSAPSDFSSNYNNQYRPMSQPGPSHPGQANTGFTGQFVNSTGPGPVNAQFPPYSGQPGQPLPLQPQGSYPGPNAQHFGYQPRPPQHYPGQPGQPGQPSQSGNMQPQGMYFPGPNLPRPASHGGPFTGRGASLPPRPPPGPYVSGPYPRYSDTQNGSNSHFMHHPQPMPPAGHPGLGMSVPLHGPNSGSPPRGGGMYQPMPRSGNAGAILGLLNDGRR